MRRDQRRQRLTNPMLVLISLMTLLLIPPTSISAQSCQPRPPVRVSSALNGAGRLNVTVTAGSGTLQNLAFAGGGSALVEIDGQTLRPPFSYPVTGGVNQKAFSVVRDGAAGTPTTLSFTVTDGCGPWQTFVGGGSTAWESPVSGQVLNAASGLPVAGASVQIQGTSLTGTSGADGRFSIMNVPKGTQTLLTNAGGFLGDTRGVQPGTSSPPLVVRLQQPTTDRIDTPAGSGVVALPNASASGLAGASVTFETVTIPGTTTIERLSPPGGLSPLPAGVTAQGYFGVSTTATVTGISEVVLPFDATALDGVDPSQLQIMQYENGVWVDHTTSVDLQRRTVHASISGTSIGSSRASANTFTPQISAWNGLTLVRNTIRAIARPPAPVQEPPDVGRVLVFLPGISLGCGAPWSWGLLDRNIQLLCDATDGAGLAVVPYSAVARGCETFPRIIQDAGIVTEFGVFNCKSIPLGRLQHGHYRFLSYNQGFASSGEYMPAQTRQSLATSADLLGRQLESWGLQGRTYDIITHSLGGAVATYWAATESNAARRAAVHSIITLDSPVNGMDGFPIWADTWARIGTPVSGDLQNGPSVDLMRSSVSRVGVVTFANNADNFVPSNPTRSAARLEYGCPYFMPTCTITAASSIDNHFEVLSSPAVRVGIQRIVAAASVRGVAKQANQPIAGATVTLDDVIMGKTSTNGEFAFLAEGPYATARHLKVTKGDTVGSANITFGPRAITTINIDVAAPIGTVSGTVTSSPGGASLDGASVQVQGTSVSTTTANGGQFTIVNLQPGNYTLVVSKGGYVTATQGVTVSAGTTSTVVIALTPSVGSISGTVTDGNNGPGLDGASVSIQGTSGAATTANGGQFSMINLQPGNYTLVVSKSGYVTATRAVTVSAGMTSTAVIALRQPVPPPGSRIQRVSTAADDTQGNGDSGLFYVAVSADGRYVAFPANASNLIPDDTNGINDVFVRDRQTGAIERVSTAADGTQGSAGMGSPALSADGRYVAFASDASNLVSGDTNGAADVFVKDRQTGAIERVSTAADGTQGSAGSGSPALSADGRYVAFASDASNLIPGCTCGGQVFVKDRQTATIWLVSATANGTVGNGQSSGPSISADGRYVAFWSYASNFVPADPADTRPVWASEDVFVKDLQTGVIEIVSTTVDGRTGNHNSFFPAISANARYVAFVSSAGNLVPGGSNGSNGAYVKDRQTGAIERVDRASNGTLGNWGVNLVAVSADGEFVTFESYSSNLVSGDTNGGYDVFVKDRRTGSIERVSTTANGSQGNYGSQRPAISPDGRYVAFWSNASNLVPGDTNAAVDVFVVDRSIPVIP